MPGLPVDYSNQLCDYSFIRLSFRGTEQWKETEEKQKETSFHHRKLHEVLLNQTQ